MSAANRMPSFLSTMKWEGGAQLSLARADPGNWTGGRVGVGQLVGSKWGVSAPVAAKRFPSVAMKDLTSAQALAVFVDGYWTPCLGDALLIGVDHAVTDCAYNAGPGVAKRLFAATVPSTMGVIPIIHTFSKRRLGFLEGLRTWKIFGAGWARRVAGVEAEAVQMAHVAGAPLAIGGMTIGDHLNAASDTAHAAAMGARKVGAGAALAVVSAPLATHNVSAIVGVAIVGAVAAVNSLWKAHVEVCRRDALGHAADIADSIA